jgi:hypothetical protein
MGSEPLRSWVTLAKCESGLAALALIAVVDASEGEGREAVSRAKEAALHTAQPVQQHQK